MELTFISPAHPLYVEELELRFRVLREPLGHRREDVPFPFEDSSLHLLALQAGKVVGCVLFHPDSPRGGRLFQMAVAPSFQRSGLGRKLVQHLEAELLIRGFDEVHLHARSHVATFYEKLGYQLEGEPYVEVGIPHRNMRKRLA